jgi:hypothetical protein
MSIQSKHTFCTHFYHMDKQDLVDTKGDKNRCPTKYLDSIYQLVKKCAYLFIICDYSVYDKIIHMRNDNVIVVKKNIEELDMYLRYNEILDNLKKMHLRVNKNLFSRLFKPGHSNYRALCNYSIITNAKLNTLKEAIEMNPFNSETFVWVDSGIFQHANIVGIHKDIDTWIPSYTETLKANVILPSANKDIKWCLEQDNVEDIIYNYSDRRKIELLGTMFIVNKSFFDYILQKHSKVIEFLLSASLHTGAELYYYPRNNGLHIA